MWANCALICHLHAVKRVTEDAVEFRLAGPDPGCGCVLDSPALTLRAVFVDFYRYFVRPLY